VAIVKIYRAEIDQHELYGFIDSSLAMQAVYRNIENGNAVKPATSPNRFGAAGLGKLLSRKFILPAHIVPIHPPLPE